MVPNHRKLSHTANLLQHTLEIGEITANQRKIRLCSKRQNSQGQADIKTGALQNTNERGPAGGCLIQQLSSEQFPSKQDPYRNSEDKEGHN